MNVNNLLSVNNLFAAVSLIAGLAAGGVALFYRNPISLAKLVTGGTGPETAPVPAPVSIPSLKSANKYQLYLFVSEFLRRSKLTRNLPSDTHLSDYEFYRIIYKLIRQPVTNENS